MSLEDKLKMSGEDLLRESLGPDPDIEVVDHPSVLIFWINEVSQDDPIRELVDTLADGLDETGNLDQFFDESDAEAGTEITPGEAEELASLERLLGTADVQGETLFCFPAVAVVVGEVAYCEAFTLIEQKVNYLRKLNAERPEEFTWMIPRDCPVGDEEFLPFFLPWTPEELAADPMVLQRPFPQENRIGYPYLVFPLLAGEPWLRGLKHRFFEYYKWLADSSEPLPEAVQALVDKQAKKIEQAVLDAPADLARRPYVEGQRLETGEKPKESVD